MFQKIKRILALVGVILLVAMYMSTLVFALIGSDLARAWLRASLGMTILVSVVLYGYILVYRMLKKNSDEPGAEVAGEEMKKKKESDV